MTEDEMEALYVRTRDDVFAFLRQTTTLRHTPGGAEMTLEMLTVAVQSNPHFIRTLCGLAQAGVLAWQLEEAGRALTTRPTITT